MKGLLPLIAATMLLVSQTARADDCNPLAEHLDAALAVQVDPIVDAALADGFAGGVAIVRDGAYAYNRVAGSADLDGQIPISPQTLFHVASITKYFSAVLTLKAAEEGKIRLDDPIAPFARGTKLAERGVTFMDLLAHRSGLGSSYAAESFNDLQQAIAAIDAAGIDESKFGSFRYSNDGYDILAAFLEITYGRSYEELVRQKLFEPACLSNVGFWGETELTDPDRVGQPLVTPPEALRKRNYGMLGSGGLLATAAELAAWQDALENGKVLSDSSIEKLFAPYGTTRIGLAALGAFLIENRELGTVISARGYEDWGDNAILNDYVDCGVIVAVVTSRGPAEGTGKAPFRSQISQAIENVLAKQCSAR